VPDTKFSREDIGVHIVFVVRGRGFEHRLFVMCIYRRKNPAQPSFTNFAIVV